MPTLRFSNWFREGFRNAPSVSQAVINRVSLHSESSGPFRYTQGLTLECDRPEPRTAAILRLLARRSPSAVLFAIRAVVVDSVQAVSHWTRTHIFVEIGKAGPAFANRYASTAVAMVCGILLVTASIREATPSAVFGAAVAAMNRNERASVAPAGSARSIPQLHAANDPAYSFQARATAEPEIVTAFVGVTEGDYLPSVVNRTGRRGDILRSGHSGPPMAAYGAQGVRTSLRPALFYIERASI